MKRSVLAGIGALAVMTIMSSANAADIERRHAMPTKAPLYAAPYNWTGFYRHQRRLRLGQIEC